MTPILLQRGPEFLKYLDELLVVVFMIAGALLPAIKQAREKKKAADRLKAGGAPDAEPAAKPTAARHVDLEARVRDYFEEQRPAARTAARPPVPPPPRPKTPAPTAHIAADFDDVHIDLKELSHLKNVTRPRTLGLPETKIARPRGGAGSQAIRELRGVLRSQASIRKAILLKEILGPPKGMPPGGPSSP